MLNRLITINKAAIIIAFLVSSCQANEANEKIQLPVKQPVYRSLAVQQDGNDTGQWGYVIFKNERLLIQQFTIPALEGNKHFNRKEHAALVGSLVAKKLNEAKHPAITKRELDSLGIIPLKNVTKEK